MPYPTVSNLIRQSSIKSVNWIAGSEHLNNNVKWISTFANNFNPDDLILISGDKFSNSLFKEAKKNNVACILLIGKTPLNNSYNAKFPIGIIDQLHNIRKIQQELTMFVLDEQVSQLAQRERVHSQLSQLSADGVGMQSTVLIMHEISGSGIIVQDKYLNILAETSPLFLREIWNEILSFVTSQKNLPIPLRDRDRAGQHRSLFTQAMPGKISRFITPIIVKGVVRGYFSIINITDKLDDLDKLVAEEGPIISAIEMSRTKAIRETEKKLHSDLLSALLNEGLDPREAALWIKEMGIKISMAHTALQFSWDAENPPSRRRLESIINGESSRTNTNIVISPMSSDVVCFFESPKNTIRPVSAINFANKILKLGYEEFPDANLRCGIGSPAQSLDDWRLSFRQATQSMELAKKLNEQKPLYFHDLSVYRLLILLENQPEFNKIYEENLGKLLTQSDNKEYIPTLEAYFENNQNLSATAKSLFIHRNTLLHRMKQISAITSLDFDNSDARLSLQIAMKIHKMKHLVKT